jgi:hypothetical protein
MGRALSLFARAATCALVCVLVGERVAAQSSAEWRVSGTVVDDASRQPLRSARVTAVGLPAPVSVDSLGGFAIAGAPRPAFYLMIRAVGFAPESLRVDPADLVRSPVEVRMRMLVSVLEPLETVSSSERGRFADFERRRAGRRGAFFTADQIRASNATNVAEVVRSVRGVQLSCRPAEGCEVHMARAPRGCPPQYFIDGHLVNSFGSSTPIRDIYGLELYVGPSETPAEFVGNSTACGVIAIWTRSAP